MKAPRFELNKIRRLINVNGILYTFKRDMVDDFKEVTGAVSEMTVKGVFHQTTQHISVVGSDAASVQQKSSPYILALYADAECLAQGDHVVINGVKYKVTGLTDVNNWNIAIDISLEAVV